MKLDKIDLKIAPLEFNSFGKHKHRVKLNISEPKYCKVREFKKIKNWNPKLINFKKPMITKANFRFDDEYDNIPNIKLNLNFKQTTKPFVYHQLIRNENNELYVNVTKLTPSYKWSSIKLTNDKFNYKK